MTQLLDEAADALERRWFFEQLASRYDAIRESSEEWNEVQAERGVEAGALADQSQ